jgi:hypothetical protein
MPRLQFLDLADFQGLFPPQAQEGPEQASPDRPHARQRTGTRATSQAKEHLFGLVIQGVAQEDSIAPKIICCGFECRVPGIAGRSFGPESGGRDLNRTHFHR